MMDSHALGRWNIVAAEDERGSIMHTHRQIPQLFAFATCAALTGAALSAPAGSARSGDPKLESLYAEAGLSEREAAAHLLNRFAFGPRPGEVDAVVAVGLGQWIEGQLAADAKDEELEQRLQPLDALGMSYEQLRQRFIEPSEVRRELMSAYMQDNEDARGNRPSRTEPQPDDQTELRQAVRRLMVREGKRPQQVALQQLQESKILRAIYSENQLAEVMADFWFNHFNIDASDRESRPHLLSYERDAIRENALRSFPDLLLATASHPAMLAYLDNAASRADSGRKTTVERATLEQRRGRAGMSSRRGASGQPTRTSRARRANGLNENYARELLELHTLGVDGGYDQGDVVEVARAFTGWTIEPPADALRRLGGRLSPQRRQQMGFIERDGFWFNPLFHDAEKKNVLGVELAKGRGIEDGLDVLRIVAQHPSTARFVAGKLAVRFVSDEPSAQLVDRLATTFAETQGNVPAVLRAITREPEFWQSAGRKIKMPFEVVVSAVRALDGEVVNAAGLAAAIERLGQPLYRYQAPTGYPETAEHWVSTGSLLNRMNFGMQLAASGLEPAPARPWATLDAGSAPMRRRARQQRERTGLGVGLDLSQLAGGEEPASLDDALSAYANLLMPERDHETTVRELLPVLGAEDLAERIGSLAASEPVAGAAMTAGFDDGSLEVRGQSPTTALDPEHPAEDMSAGAIDHDAVQQVVGVLLGSPEFQRR